jgi:hypothetical protein
MRCKHEDVDDITVTGSVCKVLWCTKCGAYRYDDGDYPDYYSFEKKKKAAAEDWNTPTRDIEGHRGGESRVWGSNANLGPGRRFRS